MRALILGGSGRLGRYLAQHIHSLGIEVDTPTIHISNGSHLRNLLPLENYQVVFNCVGLVGVEVCQTNHDAAILLNRELPTFLSNEALKYNYKFVQFSTPSVFSGEHAPNVETDVTDSPSIYGRTKLQGEEGALGANPETLVIRLNFFGLHPSKNTLAMQILENAKNGLGFKAFDDMWFNPMYALHAAEMSVKLSFSDNSGIFHIGSPGVISKYEFTKLIYEFMGLDSALVECVQNTSLSNNPLYSTNTTLASIRTEEVGFRVPSMNDGIKALISEFQQVSRWGA
jgi:dTDP-4-dehydrorhamnose reductase